MSAVRPASSAPPAGAPPEAEDAGYQEHQAPDRHALEPAGRRDPEPQLAPQFVPADRRRVGCRVGISLGHQAVVEENGLLPGRTARYTRLNFIDPDNTMEGGYPVAPLREEPAEMSSIAAGLTTTMSLERMAGDMLSEVMVTTAKPKSRVASNTTIAPPRSSPKSSPAARLRDKRMPRIMRGRVEVAVATCCKVRLHGAKVGEGSFGYPPC